MSLPSRECGLKSYSWAYAFPVSKVTPLAGVWIEICLLGQGCNHPRVTPLAGVWIEISVSFESNLIMSSHSPRGSVD